MGKASGQRNNGELRGYHDAEDHDAKEQLLTFELESGKGVAGYRAGGHLKQGADDIDQQGIAEDAAIVHQLPGQPQIVQGKGFGNPDHRGVQDFFGGTKCHAEHIQQGIQQNKAQSRDQQDAADAQDHSHNSLSQPLGG